MVDKGDASNRPSKPQQREPNLITTLEENKQGPINFAQYVIRDETKKAPIQKLTLEQFSRKVHSKHNLLFALGVKGKFPALFMIISCPV